MNAEISGGVKVFSPSVTRITDSLSSAMWNGKSFSSSCNVCDAAAHQALDGVDGAVGMIDQFLARRVADDRDRRPARAKRRWDQLVAVLAQDHFGRGQVHPRDQAVGGAEVDADYRAPDCQIRSGTFALCDQVRYVFAAVQQAANGSERFARCGRRPTPRTSAPLRRRSRPRIASKCSPRSAPIWAASASSSAMFSSKTSSSSSGGTSFVLCSPMSKPFELQQIQRLWRSDRAGCDRRHSECAVDSSALLPLASRLLRAWTIRMILAAEARRNASPDL